MISARPVALVLALATLVPSLVAYARAGAPEAPEPPALYGWAHEGTIADLLPRLVPGQVLIVEVSADWCAPCWQLKSEVLDTALGATLVESDRGLFVDFESPYGQEVKKLYGVLGLPTTFVLDREGVEIGRVEGYPGRLEWTEAVRDAKAGRFGLAALEARAKLAPRDLALQIELAQARLVRARGGPGEAKALAALDRIITRSAEPATLDLAAHAARVKGRWLLRVKEDGPAAVAHFGAMLSRFAGTKHAGHFRYWTARAHHDMGRESTALGLFEAWAAEEPASKDPGEYQADFMVHLGYPIDRTEAVVRAALARAPEAAELHYLLARVLKKKGDLAGAREAILRAVALDPTAAMYTNYQRRLASSSADEASGSGGAGLPVGPAIQAP